MSAAVATALTSCGGGSESNWQQERDSLMEVNEQQQQVLDDLTSSLVEVSASLDSIALGEGMLRQSNESPMITKEQMMQNLEAFKATLQANKERMAQLQKQLATRSDQLGQLSKLVDHLNAEIAAKEARIAELEEQLAQANADMDLLRLDINSLSKTVSSLQDENAEQRQTMEAQTAEANKAYYVIGTSRDLKEKGLLTGGLLKKKKVNYESLNQALFTKIDIRNTTQFNIPSKKAKVLTDAPSDSYSITQNGNSCTMRITNVPRFWSISRYLIIQAD
jgi:chromosome segregation ATPase